MTPTSFCSPLHTDNTYVKIKEGKYLTRNRRQNKKEQKVMKPLKELNLLDRFLFDEKKEMQG